MNHTMTGCSLSSRQMFRNVVRLFLVGTLWLFLCSPTMAQESPSDTFDYARLALPDLAERLSLTDQQRSTVTMLVAQLAEAQTLPADERTTAINNIQQQLKDVLTEEQAVELNKLPGQQKLTFNFRDQNWVDVLSWFAKQSGLSLVINDPPPKTFTYSDSKSYSPKEGLDLLNGVLVTHGFTLIRRDNLLICANIANGIPEGLIPDAELEDLDQYGKFELVRVTFPLGAKPVDQVEAEIKPLLGQYGSSVILPTTRKAVVTSSASRMRAIASTIAAIPEPRKEKPPEPPKPKEKEPPSTLAIYSVEGLDAKATLETLEKLVGGVPMTFDPQANRINAFCKPNEHEAIKRYLDQMQQDVQAGKNRLLQSYDVPGFNLERLSQQLSQLAPNASFSFDDKNSKVVVYAEAEQQEIIKQQLETLGAEVKNRSGQTVKIYLLQEGDPSTLSQVLETMFPKAAVSADATSRSVIVRAEPEDHAEIAKLMDQVKSNSPQPKQLKFFELSEPLSADSLQALGTLAPEADITTQADQRRLMVYASPEDVTKIEHNLADVAKLSEEIQRSLNVYDVNRHLRQQFDSLRSKLAPELQAIQIVETNDADRMAVVATQAQHLRLTEFLNELQVKFPEVERELRHYPVSKLQREKFNSLRSNLAPQLQPVKLVDAGRENELSAMVTAEEHEAMETFLTEIRQRFPDEPAQLQIYDVAPEQRQRFVSVLPTADEKIRNVRIVEDPNPRKLIVWATVSQHRLLDELLKRLDQADQSTQLTLINYAVQDGNAESIRTVLAELYPNTKIVADQDANRLLVWTDEEEHRQLKLAIQQLDVSPDNKNNSKMVYYRMGDIDARDIQQLVQQLVPGMSMVSDRDSNTIIAWGSEKQHEDLAKALEDFKQQAAADKKSVQVYPCSGRDPNDIRRLLYQVIPRASFVSDEYSGTVIVWGRTDEHQAVEAALAGVLQGDAGKTQSYLVSYAVDGTDADNVINMLQRLVPTGQYVDADRDTKVLAWANQEGHQKIQAVVEQLKKGDPTRATRKLQFITAPAAVIEKLQALLEQVAPNATTLPSEPGSLAVWATAEDLQVLTTLGNSIQTEMAAQQVELRPHAVKPTLSAQVREQLQQTFPTVEFVESNDPAKLLIKAKAADHEAIEQTIASLQELISEPEVNEVRVFPVGQNNNAAIIIAALDEKLKQDAILVPDENRHAIICRAPSRLQDKLQAAVESIVTALPEVAKPMAVVYRLQSTSPTIVRDVLAQLVPGTPLAIDNSAKSIVATALPDVHEKIASTIQQMDKPDSQLPLVTKVYRLQHLTADDAEPIIERVLPRMTITYSFRNNTIAATGTAEEQAKLAETVQGLDQPTANQRVTRIFAVQHVSARAVSRTIEDSFANVDATYDYESDTVFVSAPESLMPDIIKTVAEMDVQRGVQREGKVYRLEQGDVYSAISSLRNLFDDASFSGDNQSRTLMAAATPEEHVQIAKLMDELNSQTGGDRVTRVFAMQHVSARAASRTIEDAFPNVDATWDYDSDSVIVTAPESLAEAIDKLVAELDVQRGEQREAKVYRLTQGNVYAVRSSLQNLFDNAEISADDENQALMATATPKEHEQIAKLVDELNSDKTNARVTKAFAMQYASARAVSRTIEDSFPNIDSTYDYETDTVIVSAPQAMMEAITQTVSEIDVQRANQREAKVYRLEQGDVDAALYSLRALLDDASFSADDENRTILASATPEEHSQIAKLIDELNTPREDGRTTKIYPFRYGDPRAAEDVLQPLLPAAILSADRFSRSLAVTGTEKEHATVASTVAELDKPANTGRTTKVYPFRAGDPIAAQQALQALHNEAVFAVDTKSRTLIVTGTEEEHASVQTAVDKLDSKSEFDASIEAYVVSRADVAAVYTSLQQMFAANSTVSLTMDEVNRTILFKGNAEDHRTVATIIARMENGAAPSDVRTLQVYSISSTDSESLLLSLQSLLKNDRPAADLSTDLWGSQLFAVATPQQHLKLQGAIGKMSTEALDFEVFQLRSLDPYLVEQAVAQLYANSTDGPVLSSDPDMQQVIVRGTPKQIDAIRELLIKMGEPDTDASNTGSTRVIPFSGDVQSALDQIESIWPRMRKNQLQIIRPQDAEVTPDTLPPSNDDEGVSEPDNASAWDTHSKSNHDVVRTESDRPFETRTTTILQSQTSAEKTADESTAPPILIVPRSTSVAISSDDPEALAQMEMLLRTLGQGRLATSPSTGNFAVFTLKNAGARQTAKMLTDLFKQMPDSLLSGMPQVALVPDDRLNAVVVHGRQSDRNTVGELLMILDSTNIVDSLANAKPVMVKVNNTQAERILGMLENIYKTQLSSGGNRPPVDIPEGVSEEVATVLQQLNAAASGPLLTLEIDKVTNSIVIMAPAMLGSQVQSLIEKLDQAASEGDDRSVSIIPLRSVNSDQIDEVIQQLLEQN